MDNGIPLKNQPKKDLLGNPLNGKPDIGLLRYR